MNGKPPTIYSDKDSVLRRILEESPISNTTFSATVDIADDDSHKYNRVKSTKTPHKRKSRKDKDKDRDRDKDSKSYPVGPRDVARLLLHDEREALHMRKILEKTAERLELESKRAMDAEKRAHEAEMRMIEVLNATRDTQQELLRDRELLRAYQTQVVTAKDEILKAQKELDSLAEEKYRVEQEAAKERSRYRQLQKEVEVKQALERGRLEGFVDGRKEGWHLRKEYARGDNRVWRNAEYYSEGEESASIFSSSTPGPPPLTGPPFDQPRSASTAPQTGQAPITMPVPEIRTDLPAKAIPRSMTPHSNRRAASAMHSPKSRTSTKTHRKGSLGISMPVPHPAPSSGPGPSGLRQNTLSTEDDTTSIKSGRAFSTKTPLRPSSVRSLSRQDGPLRGSTPAAGPPSPHLSQLQPGQSSQPFQSPEIGQSAQPLSGFEDAPRSRDPPPIRPIPSPRPRTPAHSPIDPLPGGFIPVLDENGRISLPPPHEVDPYPPSPSAQPNGLSEGTNISGHHQHQHHMGQEQSQPPSLNINVNLNNPPPANFQSTHEFQQPPQSLSFDVPDLVPPPSQEFSIPVPDLNPRQPSPVQFGGASSFVTQNSPAFRRSPVPSERRSPRTPVIDSPIQGLSDEINDMNIATHLFETDENGHVFRPLSAIPEGGSTAAESPKFASRNPSAASFRGQGPKFPHMGGPLMNKPQPPIPPASPSMRGHSPISSRNPPLNMDFFDNGQGIYDDPREYGELSDLPNTLMSPSRQQLAEHLRPTPSDVDQIRDDVSIRTSTSRASARDRINRRFPSRDVEYLEKQAALYDNFGSGQPYPYLGPNSSDSSRDSPQTARMGGARTPAPRRRSPSVTAVPQVTLMEPSPPEVIRNRPPSRASSRRHSVTSIRSVDDGILPFIPPSPTQYQPANPITHDFRIVKNSPAPPGFVPLKTQQTPSMVPQSRMSTVGRMPATLPDRTPATGSGNIPPMNNTSFAFGATPHRVALPFSVSSTVRNLPGGTTQGAPSVRATPARLPTNFGSTTSINRKLPASFPSRGTGRTMPTDLPPLGMNFGATSSNPPAGFVPQAPSPAMSAAQFGMSGATPRMGQGTFMGRTPANLNGDLPNATAANAATFDTGTARETVPQTTSREPARLPGSRRASISATAVAGKTPARLPTQPPSQGTPAQPFIQGHSPFEFGNMWAADAPPGFVGMADPGTFRATPASAVRGMSNVRPPARLPERNSTINTPARLPLPPSNVNTPWTMGPPLTNSQPYGILPTGVGRESFVPPSPHTSATPGRMGVTLPPGGSRPGSHRGSPVRSSSPYQKFDNSTYIDPSAMHFPPSRPASRAASVRTHGTNRPASSYLVPPGGEITDFGRPTIESASDED